MNNLTPCARINNALHVVIDMQRLFAEKTPWHTPKLDDIVANVSALCSHAPGHTLFTRFVTPNSPNDAQGRWRHYYEHWHNVTLAEISPDMLDIVAPLRRFIPPAPVIDKTTHSAFNNGSLAQEIRARGASTLVLSGVETDVCVLATALDAIDRGLRVVVAKDAVTSSSAAGHEAALVHIFPRTDLQIDICTCEAIVAAWRIEDVQQ